MTPYESLMWNVWLPRLRSVIKYVLRVINLSSPLAHMVFSNSNDWSPSDPSPLIHVLEAWSDLIPPFIFDNVMDQLIMPKLLKAVSDWSKKDGIPLHNLVLPWLPHVGLRMDGLLDDARRKLRAMLRSWAVTDGLPDGLIVWRDVS